MSDKFRLLFDNKARTAEEINDELERIIKLMDTPAEESSDDSDDSFFIGEEEKNLVSLKINSIVREALADSPEQSFGEKIPPRKEENSADYFGRSREIQLDDIAYSASAATREDEQGDKIRAAAAEMRSLESGSYNGYMLRHCAEKLFVKQGEFIKNLEDDYGRSCFCSMEKPVYTALSLEQLRTYLSWRTLVRRGIYKRTDKPYILLYCYELLNKIGVMSSQDAFNRLWALFEKCRDFHPNLSELMSRWIKDFAAFNNIERHSLEMLEDYFTQSETFGADFEIINHNYSGKLELLMSRSSYNLRSSIFWSEKTRPLIEAALEVSLKALDGYLSERDIMLSELICGKMKKNYSWIPFAGAYVDLDRTDGFHKVKITFAEQYSIKRGKPCLERFEPIYSRNFIGWILKSIDSILRKRTGFRYGIKANTNLLLEEAANRDKLIEVFSEESFARVIPDALNKWCDEKRIFPPEKERKKQTDYTEPPQKREPVTIDVSKLDEIRRGLEENTRLLIVDEPQDEEDGLSDKVRELEDYRFEQQMSDFTEDYSAEIPDKFGSLPEEWGQLAARLTQEDFGLLKALFAGNAAEYCRSRNILPETEYDKINLDAMDCIGDILIENGEILEDYKEQAEQLVSLSEG